MPESPWNNYNPPPQNVCKTRNPGETEGLEVQAVFSGVLLQCLKRRLKIVVQNGVVWRRHPNAKFLIKMFCTVFPACSSRMKSPFTALILGRGRLFSCHTPNPSNVNVKTSSDYKEGMQSSCSFSFIEKWPVQNSGRDEGNSCVNASQCEARRSSSSVTRTGRKKNSLQFEKTRKSCFTKVSAESECSPNAHPEEVLRSQKNWYKRRTMGFIAFPKASEFCLQRALFWACKTVLSLSKYQHGLSTAPDPKWRRR